MARAKFSEDSKDFKVENSLHGHFTNHQEQCLYQTCFQKYLFRKYLEDYQEDLMKQRLSITGVFEDIPNILRKRLPWSGVAESMMNQWWYKVTEYASYCP